MLCSSQEGARAIKAAIGEQAGVMVPSGRRLGVDHWLQPGGKRGVLKARRKAYQTRKHLLKRLGRHAFRAKAKVMQAGLLPAFLFGSELSPLEHGSS